MKLYTSAEEARTKGELEKFLPKICPFSMVRGYEQEIEHLCGNWCPHFFIPKGGNVVKLTCGGEECIIKLEA